MRRWIISDTHFGHSMLQKHCRRPANADQLIIDNWKALVKPGELVIHIEDVAFSYFPLEAVLKELPGRKVLVLGNHDSKSKSAYMNMGFDFVCDAFVSGNIYFTHKPQISLPNGCEINIHGHLHNNVPRGFRKFPHCRLFSLEYEDYMPRVLETFLKLEKKANSVLGEKNNLVAKCELIEREIATIGAPEL